MPLHTNTITQYSSSYFHDQSFSTQDQRLTIVSLQYSKKDKVNSLYPRSSQSSTKSQEIREWNQILVPTKAHQAKKSIFKFCNNNQKKTVKCLKTAHFLWSLWVCWKEQTRQNKLLIYFVLIYSRLPWSTRHQYWHSHAMGSGREGSGGGEGEGRGWRGKNRL